MSAAKDTKEGGKKKPLPLIIGVVVLVVVLFFGKGMMGSKADSEKDKKKKKKEHEVGISIPLEEFLVNLHGGGDHYLRASISLGLEKGLTEEKFKEHTAPIRDAILSILTAQSLKELGSPKGKEELKDVIKEKINEALGDEMVQKVYFTAFATQ